MTNATVLYKSAYYKTSTWKFNMNAAIMEARKLRKGRFLIAGWIFVFMVSCEMLPEEVIRENDLAGTWKYDKVTAEVYVGKVNITRVLVVSHGYTQEEAEMLLDSLVNDYLGDHTGMSLLLNKDYTYLIDGTEEDESGTWEFDEQKDALRLTKTGEKVADKYIIEHLTPFSMELRMPDRFRVIDLNGDGKDETNCTIVAEMLMEKEKPVN